MNDNDRKLNYLLAKVNRKPPEEETELLKWLRENRYELSELIGIKNAFYNEGITVVDAIAQTQFGREFKALQAFETDYKSMQNASIVSTAPGTFIFEKNMLQEFSSRIGRLPDSIPNGGLRDYQTGMLILTLPTNKILNSGTSTYFSSTSFRGSITVIQNEIGPLITITIDDRSYSLQGRDSRILNMRQLTKVIQQHMIVLPYRITGSTVVITSMEGVLDLNAISISLEHSEESMTIDFQIFLKLMFELPPSVKLLLNIFATDFTDHYLSIKEQYTSTLIKELIPQMVTHYNTNYGDSAGKELYGQSAAVAISQLYTFGESAVRRDQVTYTLRDGNAPLDSPRYLSPIEDTSKFEIDLPLHRLELYGFLPDNNNNDVNAWNTIDVGIKYQGANFNLSSAIIGTDLGEQRPNIKKASVLKSTRIKDTISYAWIEETITAYTNVAHGSTTRSLTSVETGESISHGSYIFEPIAGGTRQKTIGDGNSAKAMVYGLHLRVTNNDSRWKTFDYTIRKNYTATATVTTQIILYPTDLSSESTNVLDANVTWQRNGITASQRISFVPKRILYGDSEINAYVGLLSTETKAISFAIDSKVTFDSERGTWNYGNIYRGNNLSELIRTGDPNAFNATPSNGDDVIPVVIATPSYPHGRVSRYVPGTVEDNVLFRQLDKVILTAPMDWPNFGSNNFNIDTISCYLSLSSKLPSTVSSPLYLENDTVDVTVTGTTDVNMDVFGYGADNVPYRYFMAKRNTLTTSGRFLIKGFIHSTVPSTSEFKIVRLEGSVSEIVLPTGVENQFSLSESLIQTRHSINLLTQYADYLHYLIQTLDKRLLHVEQTMAEIIKTIENIIVALTPESSSFGSQLLMFLATSVGMFFPLTGLAINIIGQLYSGFESITDGNLTTGTMDIAMGCLMSVLGIRKFKQRMDRKYGATSEITPPPLPNRLPSYDELYGPPGFNTVGTRVNPPSYDSLRLASGVVKNSNITYNQGKVVIDTVLLQQGLYNSYLPTTQITPRQDATSVVGKVNEVWTDMGVFESIDYSLYVQQYDNNNNIVDRLIDDVTFRRVHNTHLSTSLYVKYLYAYGNLGQQNSLGFGLDPEVMSLLTLSNFSAPFPTTTSENRYTNKHSEVLYIDKLSTTTIAAHNVYNQVNSTLSISDFADIMNPYIADKALTSQLFTNVFSFIAGSDT